MHIKQRPEDFRVEERTDITVLPSGDHAFYRLEKRGWTTPDALLNVRRRWQLDARRVSCGGLKDRHAETVQYVSIFHGPQRKLTHNGFQLHYLGQLDRPYTSEHVRANFFEVTVRAMNAGEVVHSRPALAEVRSAGVPNYFDDQRFGSVSEGGRFMARSLVLGQYEEALKVALTTPYAFDRTEQKREKALLRKHWGAWPTLKERLPRSHVRALIERLAADPHDFSGALTRLRPELRGLYLSAYQSHLWNRMLAHWLTTKLHPEQLTTIPLRLGAVPMHRSLTPLQHDELANLKLPFHSARFEFDAGDSRRPFFDRVLDEEGLTQPQFQLKGLRELFFSKGDRAALCHPEQLECSVAGDEEHPGKKKMTLRFELPRGCYATLIVKRITRVQLEVD